MGQNLTGQTIASTYEDLVQISGSILTDGTGSNINNLTVTASFATTASFALNAAGTNTGSLMVTGSVSSNTLTFTKGDGSTFNLTVNTGSAVTVNTGSLLVTASISNATTTYTKGDGSTFALTVNNVQNASTASIATSASYAQNASTADSATSASFASTAISSSYALTASFAENVTPINTGSFYVSSSVTDATITFNQGDGTTEAVTVNNVSNASTASIATSASYAVSASQAQNAVTASFALSTITGTSATASFTGTTWTFNHNLNKEYVIIDCYDSSNEEIIPQTVDLTTANTATISFPVSVQGTAVASLGNGVTAGISPISVYSQQQSEALTNYTQKLDITAVGTYAMSVSESGMHIVDLTGLATLTTANVNITLHPEAFTTVGQQAGILFTYLSGSSAACLYRTLVSASAGFGPYFSPANAIGGVSTTLSRQTSSNRRDFGSAVQNPTIMTLTDDGIYLGASSLPIPAVNNSYVGSQGTPI